MDRRPASARRFVERSTVEQQKGLAVTFFVRIWNTGNATGSFLVDGDHGGAVFTVRYLAGGTGEDRITERVVDGTYLIENVPAGETRTLRIRVTLAPNAPIDRTGRGGSSCTPRVRGRRRRGAGDRPDGDASGVVLRVPAASWLGITYHESLFGSAAALRPIGHLIQNGNGSFYPPHDTIGPGDGEPRPRDAGDLVLRRRP